MRENRYTQFRSEIVRLPSIKPGEPAAEDLQAACAIRTEREWSLDPEKLVGDAQEEYLDSIKREFATRVRSMKFEIFELGRLGAMAKRALPHGQFIPWAQANLEVSYRTCRNFIRVYKACMGHPEVIEYFKPSCLYLMCEPGFPEDFRKALFDGANGPVELSKKDLVKAALRYKAGEVTIDSEEVQALLAKRKRKDLIDSYLIELRALLNMAKSRLERISRIEKRRVAWPLLEKEEEEDDDGPVKWPTRAEHVVAHIIIRLERLIADADGESGEARSCN